MQECLSLLNSGDIDACVEDDPVLRVRQVPTVVLVKVLAVLQRLLLLMLLLVLCRASTLSPNPTLVSTKWGHSRCLKTLPT